MGNVEAEQMLLGALMLDNDLYHRISDILTDEHFFDPVHARIFAKAAARIRAGHLADPQTMMIEFASDEGLKQLGGGRYLVKMAGASIAPKQARHYAGIVLDLYQRRVLLREIGIAADLILAGGDVMTAQAGVEAAGQLLAKSDQAKPTTSMLSATVKAMTMAHQAFQGEAVGLQSGIKAFDDLVGGLFPEDMIVLAGGTGMGKTTLALALAYGFASAGNGVCFVSLEMGDYSLAQRLLAAESRIPYRDLRRGSFTPEQGQKLARAAQVVQGLPIEIVNGHIRDLSAIYATARRVQRYMADNVPGGLRVLMVDYLQLVRTANKDRFQMIAEVSMGLKNMARQLGVPVVALAQVGKDVAQRDDKRPKMADLRESGQISMDADLILFTSRDHYYLEREGPPRGKDGKVRDEDRADYEAALSACKNQMDVILAKHRHDGIGEVKLGCDMGTNRVWDLNDFNRQMEF